MQRIANKNKISPNIVSEKILVEYIYKKNEFGNEYREITSDDLTGISIRDLIMIKVSNNSYKTALTIKIREYQNGKKSIIATQKEGYRHISFDRKVHTRWKKSRINIVTMNTDKSLTLIEKSRNGKFVSQSIAKLDQIYEQKTYAHSVYNYLINPIQKALDIPSAKFINDDHQEAVDLIWAFISEAKTPDQLYPLLNEKEESKQSSMLIKHYKHAQNYAQFAKNIFGVRNYRKPLASLCEKLDDQEIAYFHMFKNLVPIDVIIQAMRSYLSEKEAKQQIRSRNLECTLGTRIFKMLPENVIRRILKENPLTVANTIRDINYVVTQRDIVDNIDILPDMVSARGQRNIRGIKDVEMLCRMVGTREYTPEEKNIIERQQIAEEKAMAIHGIERNFRNYHFEIEPEERPDREWKDFVANHEEIMVEYSERIKEAIHGDFNYEIQNIPELTTESEQIIEAQRLAWIETNRAHAHNTTLLINAGTPNQRSFVIEVAKENKTLALWGALMNHCIGDGIYSVDGDDVFLGIYETTSEKKVLVINAQVTRESGITQIYGKHNQHLTRKIFSVDEQRLFFQELAAIEGVVDFNAHRNTGGVQFKDI